jgi:hypothetical protein
VERRTREEVTDFVGCGSINLIKGGCTYVGYG